MLFSGKVVWITGASAGIGAALADALVRAGARVVLTARNTTRLQELAKPWGGQAAVLPADLLDSHNIPALVQAAIAAFGVVDVVIHSAGVSQRSLAEQTDEDVYRRLMEINFFAPASITRALLPHFRAHGGGHIVAISSMAGLMGFPLRTGYSAAKHALKGFFETLQTEHDVPGLRITIAYPGRIRTGISYSALTGDGSPHGQMDDGQRNGIPVRMCADRILHAIAREKRRVIVARGERLLWWLWKFLPPAYYSIARKKGRVN